MPKNLFNWVSNFSQAIDYVGKKLSKGNLDVEMVITIWSEAQEVSILCISFSLLSTTDQIKSAVSRIIKNWVWERLSLSVHVTSFWLCVCVWEQPVWLCLLHPSPLSFILQGLCCICALIRRRLASQGHTCCDTDPGALYKQSDQVRPQVKTLMLHVREQRTVVYLFDQVSDFIV